MVKGVTMEEERVYSVREEALKRGWQEGFRIEGNTLVTVNKEESRIIIPFFDRGYGEKRWGRLHMDMERNGVRRPIRK